VNPAVGLERLQQKKFFDWSPAGYASVRLIPVVLEIKIFVEKRDIHEND